ncbi:MAG: acetylxylan esterase [Kiritimatiellia bacterium]|jgi:cephalosporin-C deacetylase
MHTRLLLSLGLLASLLSVAAAGPLDHAWLKGTTDKDPVSYKTGEDIVLTLTPMNVEGEVAEGEYFLDWSRSGDDGVKDGGRLPFDGRTPFVFTNRLDAPGFFRLYAKVVDKDGKTFQKSFTGDTTTPEGQKAMNEFERARKDVFFDGGAGADVASLAPDPEPEDFDAFWEGQWKRLDRVPVKADRIELPNSNPNSRIFAVRVDCAGLRPVTGYLAVPKAVDEGEKFPARLETHGYSGDGCSHGAPGWMRDNEIILNINAHGLKLPAFGATEADTKALRWEIRSHGHAYAFDPKQNADPEVAYFNGMVLRVKRALQYLKTVEGWNGTDLIASGGSQGGLQTIWAAGCGEGVTRADSGITWCCDMRMNGLLRKDPANKLASDGWYIEWTDAMGYYDAVNWGKRIPQTCMTVIARAGIGDYCCPPTGIAKLYNAIPGNKKILWVQGSQHGYVPPQYEGRDWPYSSGE